MTRGLRCIIAGLMFVLAPTAVSRAGSHLWRFNEVFSNADGSVQFVEMRVCCGATGEVFIADKFVESDTTGHRVVFTEDLVGPTDQRHLLLATAGFAALPGAVTPDYIIPDNFFALDGDTLRYWTYEKATVALAAGEVPTDGVNSLLLSGGTAPNTPTNYAGESGHVDAGPLVPSSSGWGLAVISLALATSGTIILRRRLPPPLRAGGRN